MFQPRPSRKSETDIQRTLSSHGEEEDRDGHQQQPGDLAGTAADPVDERADDEHEGVHADDVQADHGEDIGLVVAVVDTR